MNRLLLLVGMIMASVLLYAAVFAIVERPLTLGDITKQLDYKLTYAREIGSPKIVILAGSNGRYSHSCRQFTAVLGCACVNASVAAGIGLDLQLETYAPVLASSDIVYMPLEYEQYSATESAMHGGVQNAVVLRHQGERLWSLPMQRVVSTFGAFDLPFLMRGIVEMALARTGFRRRTGIDTLTEQGDERDHSVEKSAAYAQYLSTAEVPDTRVPDRSFAQEVLVRFLESARHKGVIVVGGLPTVPIDTAIDGLGVERISRLYRDTGQFFIATDSRSQYPRSCFYDTTYHLNETCQAKHSLAVATRLSDLVPGCRATRQ
jgi:hypothetical protein